MIEIGNTTIVGGKYNNSIIEYIHADFPDDIAYSKKKQVYYVIPKLGSEYEDDKVNPELLKRYYEERLKNRIEYDDKNGKRVKERYGKAIRKYARNNIDFLNENNIKYRKAFNYKDDQKKKEILKNAGDRLTMISKFAKEYNLSRKDASILFKTVYDFDKILKNQKKMLKKQKKLIDDFK